VQALVNTYWVRFDHRLFTHEQAVANTRILFAAAREADVRRIVRPAASQGFASGAARTIGSEPAKGDISNELKQGDIIAKFAPDEDVGKTGVLPYKANQRLAAT
jgi:hypothetical protein